MVAEIKLVVNGFDKVVSTLIKELNTNQTLYKSVESFQLEANEMLTKMIEDKHCSGDQTMGDDDEGNDEEDDDSEDDMTNSPKKRKK